MGRSEIFHTIQNTNFCRRRHRWRRPTRNRLCAPLPDHCPRRAERPHQAPAQHARACATTVSSVPPTWMATACWILSLSPTLPCTSTWSKNEGDRLRLLWRRDIEQNIQSKSRIIRPGPNPVQDINGDGRIEIVFNLFNERDDGQWHVVACDALTGETVLDLPRTISPRYR